MGDIFLLTFPFIERVTREVDCGGPKCAGQRHFSSNPTYQPSCAKGSVAHLVLIYAGTVSAQIDRRKIPRSPRHMWARATAATTDLAPIGTAPAGRVP